MEPSVNITIDPHPENPEPVLEKSVFIAPPKEGPVFESLAGAPKPYYIPPPLPIEPPAYDAVRVLQALGVSFGIGAIVGGALVFAFSRPEVCDA